MPVFLPQFLLVVFAIAVWPNCRSSHPVVVRPVGPILPALEEAITGGELQAVRQLLDGGINPNGINRERLSAVALAARAGNEAMIAVLLDQGADPNLPAGCCLGDEPAAQAVDTWMAKPAKLMRILDLLLTARIPMTPRLLQSAFERAIRNLDRVAGVTDQQQIELLRFFVRRGATWQFNRYAEPPRSMRSIRIVFAVAPPDFRARTFFKLIEKCETDLAGAALQWGANVNALVDGESALDQARCLPAVDLLVKNGLDPRLRDLALARLRKKSRENSLLCRWRDSVEKALDRESFARGSFLVAHPFGLHVRREPNYNGASIGVLPLRHHGTYRARSHVGYDKYSLWLQTEVGGKPGWVNAAYLAFSTCESINGPKAPQKIEELEIRESIRTKLRFEFLVRLRRKDSRAFFHGQKATRSFKLAGYTVKIVRRSAKHILRGEVVETAAFLLHQATGRLYRYGWTLEGDIAHVGHPITAAFQIRHSLHEASTARLLYLTRHAVLDLPSPLDSGHSECNYNTVQVPRLSPDQATLLVYKVSGACFLFEEHLWFDSFSVIRFGQDAVRSKIFHNQGIPKEYSKAWERYTPIGKTKELSPGG